ncbi:MAG: hypothetical protein NTW28_34210 [Candidatus Solibacter sp.]|nr:hypothetical protein [Candidatus Solibacter sp.]
MKVVRCTFLLSAAGATAALTVAPSDQVTLGVIAEYPQDFVGVFTVNYARRLVGCGAHGHRSLGDAKHDMALPIWPNFRVGDPLTTFRTLPQQPSCLHCMRVAETVPAR